MSDNPKHWNGHGASSLAGTLWFIGWLFSIGFVKLMWWQYVLGIVIWPYFMGAALSNPLP